MPNIFTRSQQIETSGSWDDPFVLKVSEYLQEHLFGIDILVKPNLLAFDPSAKKS
jgi:hypothetical protein